MGPLERFRYVPACSASGCGRIAVYKIAAAWSDGTSRELKTYGLACQDHASAQAASARLRRGVVKLMEEEAVGEIGLYRLDSRCCDSDLKCVAEGDDTLDAD